SFTLSPPGQTVDATAGNGTVAVSGPAGCAWSAVSNASWIAITAGSNVTGPGAVQYSVLANTATSARSGAIAIAGQDFTVRQEAAQRPATVCTFTVSATSQSVSESAGTGQIIVTASAPTCAWTASTATSWLTIRSGASGTGNGTTTYAVAANATASPR